MHTPRVLPRECFDIKHQGDAGDITTVSGYPSLIVYMLINDRCRLIGVGVINILTALLREGFKAILLMVLRLQPGGLLVGGPPCGSWIWINRATSQRSKEHIFGANLDYVQLANTTLGQLW